MPKIQITIEAPTYFEAFRALQECVTDFVCFADEDTAMDLNKVEKFSKRHMSVDAFEDRNVRIGDEIETQKSH